MSGREFTGRDIHLALDGEMPAEERGAFEVWLDHNPDMKAKSARFAADRERLRDALAGVLDEPVPARLADFALPGIHDTAKGPPRFLWRALAAAVILIVGGLGGFALGRVDWIFGDPSGKLVADRAIAAHLIYSAEKLHVVEVGADQKAHLDGWLSKRVGVDLVAPDLTSQGFQLVGGRLLPSAHLPAAQFMYQDRAGNRISLYVVRDPGSKETGFRLLEEDGARAFYWLDDGCGYALAGTVPQATLLALANLAYRQLPGESAGS